MRYNLLKNRQQEILWTQIRSVVVQTLFFKDGFLTAFFHIIDSEQLL